MDRPDKVEARHLSTLHVLLSMVFMTSVKYDVQGALHMRIRTSASLSYKTKMARAAQTGTTRAAQSCALSTRTPDIFGHHFLESRASC